VAEQPLKTTVEWRRVATLDPLYAVASWPEKLGSWTKEEFYAVGDSDWEDFRRQLGQYWPEFGGTCVEIGCGAGRITQALARDFDRVVALDASDDMIALAREVVGPNVEFHRVERIEVPLADGSADAIFTCHVLQHLDGIAFVEQYLAEAVRVLRKDGVLMVHLGLAAAPWRWHYRKRVELALWWSRNGFGSSKTDLNVQVRLYRWDQVQELLGRLAVDQIEMRLFPVRSNGQLHAFWFARAR
jgi:SAM-dependent methyltransferase